MSYKELKQELTEIYHELLGIQKKLIDKHGPKSQKRIQKLTEVSNACEELSEFLRRGDVDGFERALEGNPHKDFIENRIQRRLTRIGKKRPIETRNDMVVIAEITNMLSKFYRDAVGMHYGETQYNPETSPKYLENLDKTPSIKLSKAIEEFKGERERSEAWSPKTLMQYNSQFEQLVEIVGDIEVSKINLERARVYKTIVSSLPPNVTKYRETKFKGQKLGKISIENSGPKRTAKTINTYLQSASSLFSWAKDQGYCDEDYFHRLKLTLPKVKSNQERDAFTSNELKQIQEKAMEQTDQWKKWVVLIGMYSGMRLNEICQLYMDDIIEEDGVLCFRVCDNKEDQRIKTTNSQRLIPIHSKLEELEFGNYLDLHRRRNSEKLFPELPYNETTGYSHKATKWFSRTFKKNLDLEEGVKSYHSLRHSFATVLQRKEVEEAIVSSLMGHSNQSITFGRYGKGYLGKQLKEAIELYDV